MIDPLQEVYDEMRIEDSEQVYPPKPRKVEKPRPVSKATSRRGELQERCMLFLGYKNKALFGIKTAHLSVDDLEYVLSSAKQFKPNPQACFWKILKESTPK